ncbi:MAG TPA: DUF362 domain-containing protein, partial [Candidatus Glassbacteria bacterium]|nr:DUF362 domain-containing protein [Candidatus Glassbacteria bacterium]
MRRRRFIGSGAALLASGAFAGAGWVRGAEGKSRVYIVHDRAYATLGRPPDVQAAAGMLELLIRRLSGAASGREGWRKILGNARTVGLKPNCLAGRGVSSSPQFVDALCRQITDSVPSVSRIVIWERSDRDLTGGGFEITTSGRVQCYGNDRGGYSRDLVVEGSVGSLVSSVVLDTTDVLINLPVLKDHGIVGLSVGMKNHYGAVHNPNKYHLNRGDPYVADLNRLKVLREKNVLTIVEAFTAQYEGGPAYRPQWSWPAGLVLASTDPVALDRVSWRMIEAKRAEAG